DFHVTGVQTCALPISLIMITGLIVFSACNEDDTRPSINEDFMNEMEAARMKMMEDMNAAPMTMDPDVDFANMMIPHHQGSVDMEIGRAACRERGEVSG